MANFMSQGLSLCSLGLTVLFNSTSGVAVDHAVQFCLQLFKTTFDYFRSQFITY